MRIPRHLAVTLLLLAVTASFGWASEPTFSAPKRVTLALGDSLAFGYQQIKFDIDPFDLEQFHSGFAFVFAGRLAQTPPGKGATLVNLGCYGETSLSFLAGPCPYHALGFPLHTNYDGAQIDAAVAFLRANPGKVSPILISLGANDVLFGVFDVCGLDPDCIGALLPGVLTALAENLNVALGRLRAAAPDAEIVMLQYYNPLGLIDAATDGPVLLLNQVIGSAAAAYRARVADAFPAFNGVPQPAGLCTLTLMCTAESDIHASDAGYALIADLMFRAAGYTRFEK
jgi:lysophospholipase L1-like esterase